MNVTLWAVAALLALVFLGAGAAKLAQPPKEKLVASPSMGWAEDFSPAVIMTIGLLEVLAALGLILPAAVGIAPDVVPLAASGLALTMIGAGSTHSRAGNSSRSS